jgi:SagB-type dehydrogenase family enzyme
LPLTQADTKAFDLDNSAAWTSRGVHAASWITSVTKVALARGVVVELYPGASPALVIPHANSRIPIAAFDAAVLCSLAADANSPARSLGEISRDVFVLLAEAGALARPSSNGDAAGAVSPLTLSDWSVLHACQYAPPTAIETAELLQLADQGSSRDVTVTPLPDPVCPPSISLWDAIGRRRSSRGGPMRDLSLPVLSALLAYAARTAASARDAHGPIYYRPAASAGARHPIDIHLVAVRADSLPPGIYHYDPQRHSLSGLVRSAPLVARLVPIVCRALTERVEPSPALVLLFDLVVDRTGEKYGAAAGGLILRDLGCLLQQLHLVLTGLDLVGCMIGRLPSELLERILRLDLERHIVVGGFAVW